MPQYFEPRPDAPSSERAADLALPDLDRTLRLTTDRAVFSGGHVDHGTAVLLRYGPPVPSGATLLDLGCGYGPIALALAARDASAQVWAVDVNRRAVDLCRRNAEANGLGNVTACTPDGVPPDLVVDAIWSNPPIRIGRPALQELLRTWLARLSPGGSAALVVQKHLGADSLADWLRGESWQVERLRSKQGFRILEVRR